MYERRKYFLVWATVELNLIGPTVASILAFTFTNTGPTGAIGTAITSVFESLTIFKLD